MITREQSERIRQLGIEFAAEQAAYALAIARNGEVGSTRLQLEQTRDAFFAAVLEVTRP